MAASARPAPPAGGEEFNTVVSIDLGTQATGYAIAFRPSTGTNDPSHIEINLCRPGDPAAGAAGKDLTAVLLRASDESVEAVGTAARKTFARLCDDGKEKRYHYFEKFKMQLSREYRRGPSLTAATTSASGSCRDVPLLTPFTSLLRFIRDEVRTKLAAMTGTSPASMDLSKVGWVLTVPAIWDDQAKAFMRTAARRAGLIDDEASSRLILTLEPEGAAIASMLGSPPEVRAQFVVGERLMVVDCGGGTVDITVSEIRSEAPLQLREVMEASGGPWGGTYVDNNFLGFVQEVLGAEAWRNVDQGSAVELMDAWEDAKRGFNPASADADVRIDMHAVARCLDSAVATIEAGVNAVNERRGYTGADRVSQTRRGALILTTTVMKSFFDPVIDKTVAHVTSLLDTAASRGTPVKFILLVGGFAESLYLQQRMHAHFDRRCVIIIPPRPAQVVTRGAAQFGLYGNAFVQSRIARWTYAIARSEKYDPAVHDPAERYTNDKGDEYSRNVLMPLVRRGDSVSVDEPVVAKGFVPVSMSQTNIVFKIYRTERDVAPLKPGCRRTYVVQASSGRDGVPETAHIATVEARACSDTSTPLHQRGVDIGMYFGRAEIVVHASASTGESKYVKISYD